MSTVLYIGVWNSGTVLGPKTDPQDFLNAMQKHRTGGISVSLELFCSTSQDMANHQTVRVGKLKLNASIVYHGRHVVTPTTLAKLADKAIRRGRWGPGDLGPVQGSHSIFVYKKAPNGGTVLVYFGAEGGLSGHLNSLLAVRLVNRKTPLYSLRLSGGPPAMVAYNSGSWSVPPSTTPKTNPEEWIELNPPKQVH